MHKLRKEIRPKSIINRQEKARPAQNEPAATGQDLGLSRHITPDKEQPDQPAPLRLPAQDKE